MKQLSAYLANSPILGKYRLLWQENPNKSRIASIEAKGIQSRLEYLVSAMESIVAEVEDVLPFDAVLVYEALHHAYDWHQSVQSAFSCLKPGGWLLICKEPNIFHTYTSYRIARLTATKVNLIQRSIGLICTQENDFCVEA